MGTLDILQSHDIVADKKALEWLVSSVREHQQVARADVYSGNAMVMRRRSLGLPDFPAEGQEDESKEMLEQLEAELHGQDGGVGGFETWRTSAVQHATDAKRSAEIEERETIIAEGTRVNNEWQKLVRESGLIDLPKPDAVVRMEELLEAEEAVLAEEDAEASLTEEQNDEIEREADALIGKLRN